MTANESQLDSSNVSDDPVASYRPDEDESVAEAVVAAVSTARKTDPTKLDPLYSVVAPGALDSLFDSRVAESVRRNGVRVTFDYESYRVHVENGDRIVLH